MSDKVILLMVSVALLVGAVLLNLLSAPKGCWDNYTTENKAITNCEATNE